VISKLSRDVSELADWILQHINFNTVKIGQEYSSSANFKYHSYTCEQYSLREENRSHGRCQEEAEQLGSMGADALRHPARFRFHKVPSISCSTKIQGSEEIETQQ
jgi:hypothetical protein